MVRDINGNRAVDGIGELFGNTLTDGFTALPARAAPLVRTSSQHAFDSNMRRSYAAMK
ncbi:hypothetical protein [Candidatus Raskinella chloraquaticus]|uniref:hypothetical protein n=1 Tax=Candidatus Raskinella chloraquaticus TaxID=1951219 RepID=UPI00269A4F2B